MVLGAAIQDDAARQDVARAREGLGQAAGHDVGHAKGIDIGDRADGIIDYQRRHRGCVRFSSSCSFA